MKACPDLIESIKWSAKTGGVMTENPAWFLNFTLLALLAFGNIPSSALLCVYRADIGDWCYWQTKKHETL